MFTIILAVSCRFFPYPEVNVVYLCFSWLFGMHPLIRIFLFVFFLFYFITGTNNAHYSKFEFGLFDILPAYGLPLLRHVQVLRSDNGG